MQVTYNGEEFDLTIEEKDREILPKLDKIINSLEEDEIDQINALFSNNLFCVDPNTADMRVIESIEIGLSSYFIKFETIYLLNLIFSFPKIGDILIEFRENGLIKQKTQKFILDLSLRYGGCLRQITELPETREKWRRITSKIIIEKNDIMLTTRIERRDGEYFSFNSGISDTLILSDHFIRRLLETFEKMDKEMILEIEKPKLDKFIERIDELKSKYNEMSAEFPPEQTD